MKQGTLIFILMLFSATELFSQIVINGLVRYPQDSAVVDVANVIIEDPITKTIISSVITDENGHFTISCKTESNTLKLTVAGFNIARHSQIIKAHSQDIVIDVEYQEIRLKEAVIKTKPIKRSGDTLTYFVSKFSDSLDYSIGDVLKKMPGISVNKSGGIKYNGKAINKFYIEGMDMMGTRYGIATNSVQAKDIATVEIYENHQPVKMFKDLIFSDDAAINLKLKNSSKGALIATMQLGAGYKPWTWNGMVTAMLFTSSYQMLLSAKSDNSGEDIVTELIEQYDNSSKLSPYIGVHYPATPDIDVERYMDNTSHAVSINNLFKLNRDRILSINGIYFYDRQEAKDSSMTIYYMPSTDPLKIGEATSVTSKINNAEMKLKLTENSSKRYIEDVLTFQAKWNQDHGDVLIKDEIINQSFNMNPNLRIKNKFSSAKTLKNGLSLGIGSIIGASSMPASLRIKPIIYPSIFGYEQAKDESAIQTMTNQAFHTKEDINSYYTICPGFTLNANLGFSLDHQKMESRLGTRLMKESPDSLCNNIISNRWSIYGKVGLRYKYKKIDISTFLDLDYAFINFNDKIKNIVTSKSKPFFKPYLVMDFALALNLKLNLQTHYTEDYGLVGNFHSGYIVTDYRTISTHNGNIAENKSQNHSINLKYANAMSALFASMGASYWRNKSNSMYGNNFNGPLSYIESYNIDNMSQGYSVTGKVSKFFDNILTTIELSGRYEQFWMDIFRQNNIMNTNNISVKAGVKWITNWCKKLKSNYTADYIYSYTKYSTENSDINPINALHERLTIDYSIINSFILNLTGEHYFNSAIASGCRNIYFLDASLRFKTKNLEYILEAKNLLNTRVYNKSHTSDATNFEYHYLLPPALVMFKVKFKLN